MVAERGSSGIERDDERVRVLELLQDPLRARAAGEEVGQRPAHLLQNGRAEQQLAHLRRPALEHLGHQVGRHRALAAGELAHEALGIGVLRKRERRQAQPGHPALGPFVQQRHGLVGERDAVHLQQPARLVEREAQVARADLGQPVGQAQAMQPQPRVLTCGQRNTERGRELAQEALEQDERVGRPELMEVVDDHDERLVERAQVGQQALDDGLAAERRRGAHALDEPSPPTASATASTTDNQKCCASDSSRSTETQATRPQRPSAHDRRRTVFPLPAGAQTSSTPAGPPADSAPNRALRDTSRRAAGERSSVAVCASNASILRLQRV